MLFAGTQVFSQTHYLTVRISIVFKNKLYKYPMNFETGSENDHPLKGKITPIEGGGVKITEPGGNPVFITTEVDLLTYLDSHGWDLVSVNEVMVIENKVLQYLFKSE